jgi:putative heme degradation protein
MTDHSQTPADTQKGRWLLTYTEAEALLQKLPQMDRVMLAIRQDDLLHERLGVVQDVTLEQDLIVIAAEADITLIPRNSFAKTYLDISVEMRGKLYPRLEFHDAHDTYLFSVTGLEGGDAFLSPLEGFERSAVAMKPVPKPEGGAQDVPEDDIGMALLTRFPQSGGSVEISVTKHGMTQLWQGSNDKIMPKGGFVNIISKPFHLHLQAGKVAHWHSENGTHRAIGHNDQPIGLEIKEL